MSLPPGRAALPVPGIDAATDPDLAKTAGELAAWIDYLLHPESHDGPRIYHIKHPVNPSEVELPYRNPFCDERPDQYETGSVIDSYAADPSAFFRAAQAVAGINEKTIETTFVKLAHGCFTWAKPGRAIADHQDDDEVSVDDLPYPALHPAQSNWIEMRKSWTAAESYAANDYEPDFVRFQLYTENSLHVIAEHLVRYRAIFSQAGLDIAELMNRLMEVFGRKQMPNRGGGVSVDWSSILITGLVVAATTVLTGGAGTTAAVVLGAATIEMLGEAAKTAETTEYRIGNPYHLRDAAKQYLDQVNKIEQDVAKAIEEIRDRMRIRLNELREARRYEVKAHSENYSAWVPQFRDYL